uniref:Uncharacterized protein n=1 Tax=Rhizophora mucronata TaxID=61149 RepID=A0A2P2R371_RHIMU
MFVVKTVPPAPLPPRWGKKLQVYTF